MRCQSREEVDATIAVALMAGLTLGFVFGRASGRRDVLTMLAYTNRFQYPPRSY